MDFAGSAAEGYFNYKAAKEQSKVAKEQLNFDKDRYKKWYNVYGTLQEDVGTYFKNLSGDKISAQERQAIQEAAQKAQEQLAVEMSQRGIEGSGIEGALLGGITWEAEKSKALSQASAEQRAAEQKMGFLALGLGQGNAIANSMSRSSANYGNAQANKYKGIGESLGYLGNYASRTLNPTGGINPTGGDGWLY